MIDLIGGKLAAAEETVTGRAKGRGRLSGHSLASSLLQFATVLGALSHSA